jgi:hypothetical protein
MSLVHPELNNGSFFYYRGNRKENNGPASICDAFNLISVLRAAHVQETVVIPELDVKAVLSHTLSLFKHQESVIYISKSADPDIIIELISRHIAETFGWSAQSDQVELLLRTEDANVGAVLSQKFKLPELPESCARLLLDDSLSSDHFEVTMEGGIVDLTSFSRRKNNTSIPITTTLEVADEAAYDYKAATRAVNRDFRTKLLETQYRWMNSGQRTGFAGEFFVHSPFLDLTEFRFSSY